MILLDTNIISELMRPIPDERVLLWMDARPAPELGITVITKAEILYGIGALPEGRKKKALKEAAGEMLENDLSGRILPFDSKAAGIYAEIIITREQLGRPISMADGQIAAICRARKCTLATRNIKDFADTGISLINPFDSEV